jgi:hypothetical protein
LHGVKQITSDDHAGVRAALMACLPGAAWQRCQFHLQQNAQKCVPKVSMRRAVAQDIRTVFNAPDRQEAERYLGLAVEKYREAAPALARWMQHNIPEGLSVFGRPASRRRLLRTTNMLERQMKEIKRRTRVAMIIPVHEVRVDEFIGAVDCAYPDTEGEFGVYLNTGYQQVSGSGQSEVMVAGIQERRYRFEDLPPMNLVIVVDTSGSMREIDKLNSVKESLLVLLDTLRDKSYLSPVLFDAEPRVLLPYIRLGDSGPLSRLRGEVRKLAAGDLRNRRGIPA